MLKLLITGVWVCAVTLGTVYFSVQMATKPPVEETAKKPEMELVKGESITVPLISDGAVKGYFISRISFMMDKAKIKDIHVPTTELMTDELFSLLAGNKMVNIADVSSFDVHAFRDTIKQDMNKKLGDAFVDDVLVEQLDYLSKDDLHGGGGKAPKPVKIVEGQPLPEAPKSGH